jgi:hypothetical protein
MVQSEPLTLYGFTKEEFLGFTYVDVTSPSGLRWAKGASSTATKGSVFGTYSRAVKHPCWRVKYNGVPMVVARVLYFLTKGIPPVGFVDHRNGDTYDHNHDNLRDVVIKVNCENRVVLNETGVPGVYFSDGRCPSWRCQGVSADGVRWVKSYSVNKYGYENALSLAKKHRLGKEEENNTQTRRKTLVDT